MSATLGQKAARGVFAPGSGQGARLILQIVSVVVLARLISPGERVTLSFQAPEAPGDYPFICSFPGHWLTMKGVMTVKSE